MVSELERRAWDTRHTSDKHPPEMAAKIVVDDIKRGKIVNVKHVVVVVISDPDASGGDFIETYQAGSLSQIASEGAVARAIRIMADKWVED